MWQYPMWLRGYPMWLYPSGSNATLCGSIRCGSTLCGSTLVEAMPPYVAVPYVATWLPYVVVP